MAVSRGLEGVIANSTALSDVLGDKGQLIYCGYDINELDGKVSYKEVVYLLWHKKLPNRQELEKFLRELRSQRELPGQVVDFLKSAPKDANPMDVMRTAISMLGLYDPDNGKEATPEINRRRAASITAKIVHIGTYFNRAPNGTSLSRDRRAVTNSRSLPCLTCGETASNDASDTLDFHFMLN